MARWTGEKPGNGPMGATENALGEAWRKAKNDGMQGVELRVAEWWVKGDNPINWARVVLTDGGAAEDEDEDYGAQTTAA